MRGFSVNKQELCRAFLTYYTSSEFLTVLCCQEHFILKANCYKIYQAFPEHQVIVKPALKGEFVNGRAKGGLFMTFPKVLSKCIKDVSPEFWRIQACLVNISTGIENNYKTILIINSYFPVDSGNMSCESTELNETFSVIRSLIENHNFDHLMLFGDLNCDFMRRTMHVSSVKRFISSLSLNELWSKFHIDFTYTFESENKTSMSVIDHFLLSEELVNCVSDAGVLHLPENTSDHEPIFCLLDIPANTFGDAEEEEDRVSKPSWKRASEENKTNFHDCLKLKLAETIVPYGALTCSDPKCSSDIHKDEIDDFTSEVLNHIASAATLTLPSTEYVEKRKGKSIPGWNDEIKEHKETASFWYSVWMSAGKPLNCVLHNIMKRTRNVFHLLMRKCGCQRESH